MMEERFATLYNPSRVSAIDEAMVPYKGRSTLKQYMPNKLVRQVWMRADSANCYVSQFQVYVGKTLQQRKDWEPEQMCRPGTS